MARTTVKKDSVKTVNYLNKDFNDFKGNLIEFAKQYFPNTYNDFNEASPGMMFVEMASYVGDVLSYYIDSQFRESMLAYAEEKRNVYNIAQSFGYKPKTTSAATVVLDVFQTVPALNNKPDTRYSLNIPAGAVIKAPSTATTFRTTEDANFKFSSSFDPMTISTFESDGGVPTKYLLKKKVKAQSGDIISEFFNFNSAEKYAEVRLGNPDVIEILSCTDSDGNKWYEVDSLARDTIFEDMENNVSNDPQSAGDSNLAPYILKLKRVSRRFSSHINENDETILRFGAGVSDNPDEEIIPNPTNVGSSLPGSPSFLTTAFDPSNFLKTSTFGLAPANTTLTIEYSFGGGVDDNQGTVDLVQAYLCLHTLYFDNPEEVLPAFLPSSSAQELPLTSHAQALASQEELLKPRRSPPLSFEVQDVMRPPPCVSVRVPLAFFEALDSQLRLEYLAEVP